MNTSTEQANPISMAERGERIQNALNTGQEYADILRSFTVLPSQAITEPCYRVIASKISSFHILVQPILKEIAPVLHEGKISEADVTMIDGLAKFESLSVSREISRHERETFETFEAIRTRIWPEISNMIDLLENRETPGAPG